RVPSSRRLRRLRPRLPAFAGAIGARVAGITADIARPDAVELLIDLAFERFEVEWRHRLGCGRADDGDEPCEPVHRLRAPDLDPLRARPLGLGDPHRAHALVEPRLDTVRVDL